MCEVLTRSVSMLPISYLAWQALYLVKTELFDSEKLQRDQDLQTSIRWLTRDRDGVP